MLLTFANAEVFFPFYDTNEVIFETSKAYISQDEIAEYCQSIAQEIVDMKKETFTPKSKTDKLKIAKSDIRIYCAEKEIEKKYITLISDYVGNLLSL
jgi:hypothetical protein